MLSFALSPPPLSAMRSEAHGHRNSLPPPPERRKRYSGGGTDSCRRQAACLNNNLVLHSDNGAPMKSQTMKAKLEELSVESSYNRPRVSNDNPYSESTFRTLKYRPDWPSSGFESLAEAQNWVQKFVDWYNEEHKHSKINFVTPSERHDGVDGKILAKRKRVLEAKKAERPDRWSKDIRNCEPAGVVMLNPDKPETAIEEVAA